jgi:acyl dehydratase
MQFSDFHPGQTIEFGQCVVTEQEVVEFASRYDPQPFHVDKDWAARSRWEGLIGSGFHTCGMAMRMVVDHLLAGSESIGSPGIEYVKWPAPVRPGDALRMKVRVLETNVSRSGRVGAIRWQWLMMNQRDQAVLDLMVTSLFALRAKSPNS